MYSVQSLKKLLKPIYESTRKSRHFIWEKGLQEAFDEIKARLQRPPVLSMPDKRGRFTLYSDTRKHATGSALYQVQDGSPRLIAYVSKRMPEAAMNYSITELEMCGLAINIASFAHLLKRVDFDAVVDHLAKVHIMKSKAEPTSNRIKRLLERSQKGTLLHSLCNRQGDKLFSHSPNISGQIRRDRRCINRKCY